MPAEPTDFGYTGLLTSDEVVDRLADQPFLRRTAVRCVLKAIRFGARWRFRQSELEAWIERERLAAETSAAVDDRADANQEHAS